MVEIILRTENRPLSSRTVPCPLSSSYLQKESCIKEFQDIFQKKLNSEVKIIPIILDSFDNLSELPKNLSNIKSLSLIDCCSEEDFSQRITSLANDLIKQRKD